MMISAAGRARQQAVVEHGEGWHGRCGGVGCDRTLCLGVRPRRLVEELLLEGELVGAAGKVRGVVAGDNALAVAVEDQQALD